MHFSIVALFPEYFVEPLKVGIVGQSFEKGRVTYNILNPRDFVPESVHKAVDDRPFGGGDGMVMMAEPLALAIAAAKSAQAGAASVVVNFTPQGRPLSQPLLEDLAKKEHLILLCGRYAGIDERLVRDQVDLEVSLGDFVLSGGEIAALALIDGVTRLLPHTLGNEESAQKDSFSLESVFEAPLFTRPAEWRGQKVPEALLSGHHKKIEEFRHWVGLARALKRRPELFDSMDEKTRQGVEKFIKTLSPEDLEVLGLTEGRQQ